MEKPTIDSELEKAFSEMKVKMIETSKKIKDIDKNITILTRVQNQVKINALRIAYLPDNTISYEAVGRMFLRKDFAKRKQNLAEHELELITLIRKQNDSKEYLKKNLEECEDCIREMVQLRKA